MSKYIPGNQKHLCLEDRIYIEDKLNEGASFKDIAKYLCKDPDNARCESMWARMKSELLYGRYDTEKMTTDELRTIIWRYFISYWNNRRICSANGGLPPMLKRQQYYDSLKEAA